MLNQARMAAAPASVAEQLKQFNGGMIGRIEDGSVVERAGEIQTVFEALRQEVAQLNDELDRLTVKLALVLAKPPGVENMPVMQTTTPLGGGLAEIVAAVGRARLRVELLSGEVAL